MSTPFRALVTLSALSLTLSACGNSTAPASAPPPPATGAQKLTVVVAVIDSLMPSDLGAQTPTLNGLIEQGTYFPESRAVFSAETIPNHVAMMTGVYPERSGIATNNFIDFDGTGEARDLSLPEELTARTLFTWVDQRCRVSGSNPDIRTGATLSKKYLYEIFAGDAADGERQNRDGAVFNLPPDDHWDPRSSPLYIGPGFEYTPDRGTLPPALEQLPGVDFQFINLGSVDRNAHAFGAPARALQVADTDALIADLVSALQDSGRWEHTVLIVTSDHGMDFTLPGPSQAVTVQPLLDQMAACYTPLQAVQNGGTDSLFVLDRTVSDAERKAALHAVRACLLGSADCATLCPGAQRPSNAENIVYAWYTQDDPSDPTGNMPPTIRSRHPNLGDLVLVADAGLKFSEPNALGNPIPGNHGQVATLHNFMLVTGGSEWVRKGLAVEPSVPDADPLMRLPEQSETVDIAPTVAWLLGLGLAAGDFPDGRGFDGRVLGEAFTQFENRADPPSPTVCGRFD